MLCEMYHRKNVRICAGNGIWLGIPLCNVKMKKTRKFSALLYVISQKVTNEHLDWLNRVVAATVSVLFNTVFQTFFCSFISSFLSAYYK